MQIDAVIESDSESVDALEQILDVPKGFHSFCAERVAFFPFGNALGAVPNTDASSLVAPLVIVNSKACGHALETVNGRRCRSGEVSIGPGTATGR